VYRQIDWFWKDLHAATRDKNRDIMMPGFDQSSITVKTHKAILEEILQYDTQIAR
jgi:hypothetical protein